MDKKLEARVREIWARKVAQDPVLADFVAEINRMAEEAHARKPSSKSKRAAMGGEE
jgi:hypothetical protein